MSLPSYIVCATERELALAQLLGALSVVRAEKADLAGLTDACLALGRARAEEYRGHDPEASLADLGYRVLRIPGAAPGSRAGFHLCAMTRAAAAGRSGGAVELFTDEISAKREGLLAYGISAGQEELEVLHLAHELYHALEFSCGRMTAEEVPAVRVHGFLGWHERRLAVAGEIAAHAFARRMTDSRLIPQLVDALALMEDGSLSRESFHDRVERAREMLASVDAECNYRADRAENGQTVDWS